MTGTINFTVQATDTEANVATGPLSITVSSAGAGGGEVPNTVTIYSDTGSTQINRPITIPRFFADGEIASCPQPVIGGTAISSYQVDTQSTWPDGSFRFGLISFVMTSITTAGTQVSFQNAACPSSSGALTPATVISTGAYNFDAQIQSTSFSSISARTMLNAGAIWKTWLSGPIVSAWIVEDRSAARAYDTKVDANSGTPLHPQFEVWCYQSTQSCEVWATMENAWISNTQANSARDQTYAFTLTTGNTSPTTQFTQASFDQIAFTRWHKGPYWIANPLGAIRIDFNQQYVSSSKATQNYQQPSNTSVALGGLQSAWTALPSAQLTIAGNVSGLGDMSWTPTTGGDHPWIGPQAKWESMYLLTYDDTMRSEMLTDADLLGYTPFHMREADERSGGGKSFDGNGATTEGRVFSVYSRPTASVLEPFYSGSFNDGCAVGNDIALLGTFTNGPWSSAGYPATFDPSHYFNYPYLPYIFTGEYYYLEEMLFDAGAMAGYYRGCSGGATDSYRQGSLGLLPGVLIEPRTAWGLIPIARAAALGPTVESGYFTQIIKNNISMLEGGQGVPSPTYGDTTSTDAFNFGKNTWPDSAAGSPSPLGIFASPVMTGYNTAGGFAVTNCSVADAAFQEIFITTSLQTVREMGFNSTNILKLLAARPFNTSLIQW